MDISSPGIVGSRKSQIWVDGSEGRAESSHMLHCSRPLRKHPDSLIHGTALMKTRLAVDLANAHSGSTIWLKCVAALLPSQGYVPPLCSGEKQLAGKRGQRKDENAFSP